jgi:hypothetical protein
VTQLLLQSQSTDAHLLPLDHHFIQAICGILLYWHFCFCCCRQFAGMLSDLLPGDRTIFANRKVEEDDIQQRMQRQVAG